MSSFLRKGKRQLKANKYKDAKKSLNEIKRIVKEIDYITSVTSLQDVELTEDNVVEEAGKISNLKIGKLEKSMLLQKHYGRKVEQEKPS